MPNKKSVASDEGPQTFGSRLKMLRKANSLSQAELGARVDATQSTIGNWENNLSVPNLKDLQKLATVFGVSVGALVSPETHGGDADFAAARALIERWSPAFVAIKQAVNALAEKTAPHEED